MFKKYIGILLVICILLSLSYSGYPKVYSLSGGFKLVDTYWGSIDNPRKVYPGSSNVLLYIEVVNHYNFTLNSVVGLLHLPTGFKDVDGDNEARASGYIREDDTIRRSIKAGESFILTYTLSISESVDPGIHYASLNLTFTYLNKSTGKLEDSYYIISDVPLKVSDFPTYKIDLKEVYWVAGGERVNATPGSSGLSIYIELYNNSTEPIDSLESHLYLKPPFRPRVVSDSVNNIDSHSSFTLIFNDISVDRGAQRKIYDNILKLKYTFRGYGNAVKEYTTNITVSIRVGSYLDAGVHASSAYWENNMKVYPGSREVYLIVELENVGRYTLSNIRVVLKLPEKITNQTGGSALVTTYNTPVAPGDYFTLRFGPIYVDKSAKPGVYRIDYTVIAYADVDGSTLMAWDISRFPIWINSYTDVFEIVGVEWRYNNGPAVAFPGSNDISYVIKLVYRGEYDIYGIDVKAELPDGFRIKSIDAPTNVVTKSSVFEISISLDISSDITPDSYPADFMIKYTVNANGQNVVESTYISTVLTIYDPKTLDTDIRLVNVYWGVETPIYVYPGSVNNPLTLTISNEGGYTAESVRLSVRKYPEGFDILPLNSSITSVLNEGGFAKTTFYVNVSSDVVPGRYRLKITVYYEIRIYGSVLDKYKDFTIEVIISKPIFKKPFLKIYRVEWSNEYDVYPGTKNSILELSYVNDAMYPVSGIHIWVYTPDGVNLSRGINFFYVPGPIDSLNTFRLELHLDFSKDINPGYHNLTIKLEYVLESGGPGVLISGTGNIEIYVSPLTGVRYISHMWVGRSPGGGSAGVTLLLIFRDDSIDVMKGLYATLYLPKGFISVDSGSNVFNATPVSGTQLNQLLNIATETTPPLPTTTQVSMGDYIIIPARLIISPNITRGIYNYTITFNFMDGWDSIHELTIKGSFMLPGSAPYIEIVEEESHISLGEKISNVTIYVRNPGDGPVYDVYIGIASYSQAIAFSSSIKYVKIINPNETIKLVWRAAVNPEASITGSIPALVTISYVDPNGYRANINQTIILYVLGLARIKVIDLDISPEHIYTGGEFSVSVTIVNTGKDTARNVEAYLEGDLVKTVDTYTFIGDIDVGYQMPFTLYAKALNETGWKDIYLIIKYYDLYNQEYTVKKPLKILVEKAKPKPEVSGLEGFVANYWYLGVLISVVIFLAVAGYLIYRVLKVQRTSGV